MALEIRGLMSRFEATRGLLGGRPHNLELRSDDEDAPELSPPIQTSEPVETDEDPDFDNEDNGPEDVLEEIFSDHESFCEHDTEYEEDGDSGNEDVNNVELFSSKEGTEWRKTKFRQNIRCHNIVPRLPGKRTSKTCDKPCEELGVIHQR
ncbi:hypothetical protein AVEN_237221-1 [Araneus ventricosus]|uniref:Uncharacterized protein n=1 Tax=Araneus ventricosus TaxID=182803 RepID=A0A4Y2M845_ARAVE|nr:hypothetical protein AVEN_237221-1 [Araneus ventricosus]